MRGSSSVPKQADHQVNAREPMQGHSGPIPIPMGIVPDQLLKHIISSDGTDTRRIEPLQSRRTLERKIKFQLFTSSDADNAAIRPKRHRQIYDMQNQVKLHHQDDVTYKLLPGKLVRSEGDKPILDRQANEAYDNCAIVVEFYHQVFKYTYLDDVTAPIISSIHFGIGYQNAQWIGGNFRQMIYGDGGTDLYNFTACLDIIAHEMTHAVTERLCTLKYQGESGALNEHLSDAFAMMITMWAEQKPTTEADWLIGEYCLKPGVKGVALRNMKSPGTAYEDPKFGKDPQPSSMAEIEAYKAKNEEWARYDCGCVHAFSGVPNRAFVLVAEALGGNCWERAGEIWWVTVKTGNLPVACSFVEFADATVDTARTLFGDDVARVVRQAWDVVGVRNPILCEPSDPMSKS